MLESNKYYIIKYQLQENLVNSYMYCANNPVKYIDPDGRMLNNYTVNINGVVSLAEVTTDKFDVLYNEKAYNAGKRDFDDSGTKNGIKIEKGEVKNIENKPAVQRDTEGREVGRKTHDKYEITSADKAEKLMNFLDKNTNVEFGNTQAINSNGKEINIIYTSKNSNEIDNGDVKSLNKYLGEGHTVIKDDHIHPDGAELPSGSPKLRTGTRGDVPRANDILKYSPNAQFRVLANGKYYPYNQYLTKP